jgi:hypothetical protein
MARQKRRPWRSCTYRQALLLLPLLVCTTVAAFTLVGVAQAARPAHERYAPLLKQAYRKYGVLPRHLAGLIDVESGWDRYAVSPAGARYLTQFMPGTGASYGVYGKGKGAVRSQIFGAAHYLKDLGYKRGDPAAIRLAFASYNAGPGNPGAAGSYPEDVLAASGQYRGIGKGAGRSGTGLRAVVRRPSVERGSVEPGGEGLAGVLRDLLVDAGPAPIQSAGLAPPSFSAQAVLPSGYRPLQPEPVAPRGPDRLDAALTAISALRGAAPPRSTVHPGSVSGGVLGQRVNGNSGRGLHYGPSGGRGPGEVVGEPLDRPGAPTAPYVIKAVKEISAILGAPIQLGTGTQHSQYTTNGTVSAHWDGHAIDLPSRGKKLYAIGRSALIAAGMDPKKARKAPAGLYNVGGWQIIFGTNSLSLGGDHTDHVHVAPPRH